MSALFPPDPEVEPAPPAPARDPAAGGPTSLYRKYRPQSFGAEELVGQETIVRTLRNAIRLDRVAHAYLFCGPRGTGKTTTARILAKAVNCLDPDPDHRPCNSCANCRAIAAGATTDVVEIDAASNRGIDDIRDLREKAKYAPTQLKAKFYIVDEAHQITGAAANAFLKTLEEPPAHTKFVLATTDPEELLPTIVSRCQRFDFRRVGAEAMVARLRAVAAAEAIAINDEALATVARHAGGSLRDALGLLDQLSLYQERGGADQAPIAPIDAGAVLALLGVSRNDRVEALAAALAERDAPVALATVNQAVEAGIDARVLNRQLVAYLRLLLHQRAGGTADADEVARALAARFELGELADLARRFGEIDAKIRHSPMPQLPLEVALVEGALRGMAPGASARAATDRDASSAPLGTAPSSRPSTPEAEPPAPRPKGPSLADRVRGVATAPVPAPTRVAADAALPAPTAPPPGPRPAPPPAAAPVAGNGAAPVIGVDQLADLWPRVRQDVKAVNRRIEALLSSVDPVAVHGAEITLASAYEFHRDKLNTDEVRAVVEGVLARHVGRSVHVSCVLRGEVVAAPVPAGAPSAPPTEPAAGTGEETAPPGVPNGLVTASPADGEGPDYRALDEQRLRAAINIFDAEEIDPEQPMT